MLIAPAFNKRDAILKTQPPENPLTQFCEIDAALNEKRRWYQSGTYLRYAAIAAVCCEGSPHEIARAIRDTGEQLKNLSGWFGPLNSEIRFAVAAILTLQSDDSTAFMEEVDRVRPIFRDVGLRRDAAYEMLAILVMRSGLEREPIGGRLAERVKELYEEMKAYHWWLTSTDDIPVCAMLALRDEPIGLMAQRIEQIFQGLRAIGLSLCNELQSAANLLFLAEGRAELAVGRAGELMRRFKARGRTIRRAHYDELAILSFLLDDPNQIVERVMNHFDHVRKLKPRPDKNLAFNIAANIAFLEFMRFDDELLSISRIKLIIDIQAAIAAQRAAAAAAAG